MYYYYYFHRAVCKKSKEEEEVLQTTNREKEVEAGDPDTQGDMKHHVYHEPVYPKVAFHLVCTVLPNMSNTVDYCTII